MTDFLSGEIGYNFFKTWNNHSERQGRRILKNKPHIYIAGRALISCNNNEPVPELENRHRYNISGEIFIDFCIALGYSERHARRMLKANGYTYLKQSGKIFLKESDYHKFISDNFSRPQIQFI